VKAIIAREKISDESGDRDYRPAFWKLSKIAGGTPVLPGIPSWNLSLVTTSIPTGNARPSSESKPSHYTRVIALRQ
jgi:hypothetical protein